MADPRLTRIDELLRDEHSHLPREHECWFLREYTSRQGYTYSETNNLIHNFKKPVDRRGKREWRHKEDALQQLARELRVAVGDEFLSTVTLVPMPPSKAREDPAYDDRMLQLVRTMMQGLESDIRELLAQKMSTDAAHQTENRRNPFRIAENLAIDPALTSPAPSTIAVFDDVLTTGAHFRAATMVLRREFPQVELFGIFIARRVFAESGEE